MIIKHLIFFRCPHKFFFTPSHTFNPHRPGGGGFYDPPPTLDCLEAAGKSREVKKVQKHKNLSKESMNVLTDKDLKSKHFRGKKFIYQPRMMIQKENLISKPKQFRLEKGLFFWSP